MAAMSDAQPSPLNLWVDFLATNKVDETSAPLLLCELLQLVEWLEQRFVIAEFEQLVVIQLVRVIQWIVYRRVHLAWRAMPMLPRSPHSSRGWRRLKRSTDSQYDNLQLINSVAIAS